MNKNNFQVSSGQLLGLIVIAYIFSFLIRMIWVWQFQDNQAFIWNNELMINTNDGYTWASGAQKILEGVHLDNVRIPNVWKYSTVFFTVWLTKLTPFSLETVILYMPALISSLVVIPIILIARLYGQSIWGFLAALLGSIAWSYYNRTMIGYYDTDMFSAMAPMFILYFLMKSTIDFKLRTALYAGIAIVVYPFLYDQGKSVIYAMGITYAAYMIFYHHDDKRMYLFIILVFFALLPLPIDAPFNYFIKILVLIVLYFGLRNRDIEQTKLMIVSAILMILFMYFGNVFGLIIGKMMSYVSTGTNTEGLHFFGVHQTIREAGKIPFEMFANRISGSRIGLFMALIGYIALVLRYRAFILALPLVAIGMFALWGGLRFTVYAVPIAAMSAIYLFFVIGKYIEKVEMRYLFITLATGLMIYPNITHIIGYKVPTVLNKAEVEDLVKLKQMSNPKDYTLTWWDYGYPIWYYSDTCTLIDGGKHNDDNFIISTIMQSTSSTLASNLSRVAVENYAEGANAYRQYRTTGKDESTIPAKFRMLKNGNVIHGGGIPVSDYLFKNKQADQKNPNEFLAILDDKAYTLPKKTRDIYWYLPYRMLHIFPTVALFGNLDLNTGKSKRKMIFYPTSVDSNNNGMLLLKNGIIFDTQKGLLTMGGKKVRVKNFIITSNTKDKIQLQPKLYHIDGTYAVIYMKSYGEFLVMDTETFNSLYIQMFVLGKYDKNLFDLVVASPYSRIYKLKH